MSEKDQIEALFRRLKKQSRVAFPETQAKANSKEKIIRATAKT